MESIKEMYKIGNGPSSSHTMGPQKIAEIFREQYKEADKYEVILYGSLAATGRGHLTDYIIEKTLKPVETEILFNFETECDVHPNTVDMLAYKNNKQIGSMRAYSIGGGNVKIEGQEGSKKLQVYKFNLFTKIKKYCIANKKDLFEYAYEIEGTELLEKMKQVWKAMKKAINEGLNTEGLLPGELKITRKAKSIYESSLDKKFKQMKQSKTISAYAYAVSEVNASGGIVVTAPTCGSAGVLPAVLYYLHKTEKYTDDEIVRALAVAGLIGNIVKTNASVSGAECGCQAEIGTACSMAAAATAYLRKLNIEEIESAAEIAMEHHLGLTCDPIYGYVQIPCIERNAIAAMRAIDACNVAMLTCEENKISFDLVVNTMYETGKEINRKYRETSEGGLAEKYEQIYPV